MNDKFSVIDNFLPDHIFEDVKNKIMGNRFPWYVCDDIVNTNLGHTSTNEKYNWQLFHLFYYNPHEISQYIEAVDPLLLEISPMMLLKVKANLNPASEEIIEHGMHIDTYPVELAELLTTSVFYLNTNNGYTLLEDGTKIESVENRLISFPATTKHTGSTCTDAKNRAVINLNYIARPKNTRESYNEL